MFVCTYVHSKLFRSRKFTTDVFASITGLFCTYVHTLHTVHTLFFLTEAKEKKKNVGKA